MRITPPRSPCRHSTTGLFTVTPYVEAGCRHVNFVVADAPEAILDRALSVAEELRKVCG